MSVLIVALPGLWVALGCFFGVFFELRPIWWLAAGWIALATSAAGVVGMLARRGVKRTRRSPVFIIVANRRLAQIASNMAQVAAAWSGPVAGDRLDRYQRVVNAIAAIALDPHPDPRLLERLRVDALEQRARWAPEPVGADSAVAATFAGQAPEGSEEAEAVIDLTDELLGDREGVGAADGDASGAAPRNS